MEMNVRILAPWKVVLLRGPVGKWRRDHPAGLLFKDEQAAMAYKTGHTVEHVDFDLDISQGSSWTHFGEGTSDDRYCDDVIITKLENVVPYDRAEYDAWYATLEVFNAELGQIELPKV